MNIKRELRELVGSFQPQLILTGALEFPGGTATPPDNSPIEILIGGKYSASSVLEILGAELAI
jgi:hypothetical protein